MKYSVIIPAYNAEKTIETAISSVVSHLENYEIIVIENGSSDHTAETVQQMQAETPELVLLHSDKGVSKARNLGIQSATGDWIAFLDADDQWIGDVKNVDRVTESFPDVDIICYGYQKGKERVRLSEATQDVLISGEQLIETIGWMISKPTMRMTVWAKLFRREFLQLNALRFNEMLRVSEDSEYMVRCLIACRAMVLSPSEVYRYCIDSPSTTRSVDETRRAAYLESLTAVEKDLQGADSILSKAFTEYVVAQLNLIAVHDIYSCENTCSWTDRNRILRNTINHCIIRREIDRITIRDTKDIHLLPAYLFSKGLVSFGGIMCYFRSVNNKRHQKREC